MLEKALWVDKVLDYHFGLDPCISLPDEVEWLLPYEAEPTREVMRAFYRKYYSDNNPRSLILGINPGRFGAGVTGVPFTDPVRLEEECGIINPFDKKREISSIFIYEMINAYGSPDVFYREFLISSLCPLGFLKEGKNYNFYDDRELAGLVQPMITENIRQLIAFGGRSDRCYCLGKGKNARFLERLNEEEKFFEEIIVLPHPRWIMQYRLKEMVSFLDQYLEAFQSQNQNRQ